MGMLMRRHYVVEGSTEKVEPTPTKTNAEKIEEDIPKKRKGRKAKED